jgi:putative membrane protein
MKKVSLLLLLAISTLSFQACSDKKKESDDSVENAEKANDAKEDAGAGQSEDTNEFAVKAANGGMLEVELGRLAEEKAQSKDVKEFGAMMVKDHSKANEELKTIAATQNITLPTTLGEDEQKHVNEMAKLSGAEFDKKYVSMMVDDHKEDIDLFKKTAEDDKANPAVKSFAAKTLPTLQKHMESINAIDKKID